MQVGDPQFLIREIEARRHQRGVGRPGKRGRLVVQPLQRHQMLQRKVGGAARAVDRIGGLVRLTVDQRRFGKISAREPLADQPRRRCQIVALIRRLRRKPDQDRAIGLTGAVLPRQTQAFVDRALRARDIAHRQPRFGDIAEYQRSQQRASHLRGQRQCLVELRLRLAQPFQLFQCAAAIVVQRQRQHRIAAVGRKRLVEIA